MGDRDHRQNSDGRGLGGAAEPTSGDGVMSRALAHKMRQKRAGSGNAQAAKAYRRMLSDKFDKFDATVNQACLIFEEAFRQEKRPKDPDFWTSFVIDTMMNEIIKAVMAEFKVEIKLVQKLSEYSTSAAKKGFKAQKGADDYQIIGLILTDVRLFSHSLVHEAKAEIATIPDDQAAVNYQQYQAVVNSPEVEAASRQDPIGQDVQAAVQDEMLEAQGAPITGASEAEVIAVRMLRAVKAEMVNLAVSPADKENKIKDTISNPAGRNIPQAEKTLHMQDDIYNDQKSRERAEPLVKGGNS